MAPPNPEVLSMIDRPIAGTVELAVRFALANKDIDVVCSGMTKCEWVTQNAQLASLDQYLTDDDLDKLQKMLREKESLAKLYCTGCRYCMPCPNGVEIAWNFHLMNMFRIYGLAEWSRKRYKGLKEKRETDKDVLRASACTECGKCLSKCPNKIPIIEQLKEVAKVLG